MPRALFLQQFARALIENMPALPVFQPSSLAPESEETSASPAFSLSYEDEQRAEEFSPQKPSSAPPSQFSLSPGSTTPQARSRQFTLHPRHRQLLQHRGSMPFPSSSHPAAPLPYRVPSLILHQRRPPPKIYLAPPTESWLVNMQSLSRIQSLLKDPTITTVECPGPGIPLTLARGSLVQSTPFHFSAEEIDRIIRDISERTHIPLSPTGIFKAAIGNVIITAVLSEFVGTRFIIQKKKPSEVQPLAPVQR